MQLFIHLSFIRLYAVFIHLLSVTVNVCQALKHLKLTSIKYYPKTKITAYGFESTCGVNKRFQIVNFWVSFSFVECTTRVVFSLWWSKLYLGSYKKYLWQLLVPHKTINCFAYDPLLHKE